MLHNTLQNRIVSYMVKLQLWVEDLLLLLQVVINVCAECGIDIRSIKLWEQVDLVTG